MQPGSKKNTFSVDIFSRNLENLNARSLISALVTLGVADTCSFSHNLGFNWSHCFFAGNFRPIFGDFTETTARITKQTHFTCACRRTGSIDRGG